MAKIISFCALLLVVCNVCAQGVKISVSVHIDSIAENYQLRNFICDSFTCIFQQDKFLFYEKSFRVGQMDMLTGEIIKVEHLPPNKLLIENGKIVSHNSFSDKKVSMETGLAGNPRIPFQMFKKFNVSDFAFTNDTKVVAGILCYKGVRIGPDGDSTIIWMQTDTASKKLKSMFNFFFNKPPANPILEISFKNFRMTKAIVEELRYQIYAFEVRDFSSVFDELNSYKRVSQEEYMQLSDESMRAVEERWKKEKGNNK